MATSSSKLSIIIFFLLFSILFLSSSASSGVTRKYPSASLHRSLLAFQRNKKNQIPNCSEMASRSQCLQNPMCRWCRSEVLDDMCFSKGESWRLPEQKEAQYFGQVKLLDLKLPSQENLIADKFYG